MAVEELPYRLSYRLDLNEILLLSYIYDAQASPTMSHIIDNGNVYTWLNHAKIQSDLPILNVEERQLKRFINHLVESDLICSQQVAVNGVRGSRAYYGITETCEKLRYDHTESEQGSKMSPNSGGLGVKNVPSYNLVNLDNKLDNTISKDIVAKAPTENPIQESDIESLTEYEQHMYSEDVRKKRKIEGAQPQKTKKLSLWDKCVQDIEAYTADEELRESLKDYLKLRLAMKDKPMYQAQWRALLKKIGTCSGDPQSQLNGFMLRRLKSNVLDLPEKTYINEYVEMTAKQAQIYKEVYNSITANLDLIKAASNPLAEMIRLRQATGYTGILSSTIQESAKLDRMEELVEDAIANGKKVVIFSNWTQMTGAICDRLRNKYGIGLITGETPDSNRQTVVQMFQEGKLDVLVGTIGAMGTGLTLTAGTVEIFMDEPWNRANKEQAEDRCHRIGQTENLTIYTLLTKNTIDERIHELVMQKGAMADMLVDGKVVGDKGAIIDYLLS